jgi:hypothetical protein
MMSDISRITQCDRLLHWFKKSSSTIDPLTAWEELGIYRLAARINNLRERGHDINTNTKEVCNRFGEPCRVAVYEYQGKRYKDAFAARRC